MRLSYVILYVPDVVKAVEFYEKAFGLQRTFVDERGWYAELTTGSTVLAFRSEERAHMHGVDILPQRTQRQAGAMEIAFVTPDLHNVYKTALAAGAVVVQSPVEKPWGQTVAFIRDLNGFLIELATPLQG